MKRTSLALLATLALGVVSSSAFAAPKRPVVVELFTSEGCSSCPPADALLTDLARSRRDVLPLAFHVTYWNDLGWHDPFSMPAATERQNAHAARRNSGTVFTPEMVIDGAQSVVGSHRSDALAAIERAAADPTTGAAMRLSRSAGGLAVDIEGGSGRGTVLLVGFDPEHRTAVGRGENSGRTLLESNIVRSLVPLGAWTGSPLRLQHSLPAGQDFAALLQRADGRIIGAARLGGDGS